MAAKKRTRVSAKIQARARQVLEFAKERAQRAADWIELDFALFRVGGIASELFPTEAERTAFCKTAEYEQILALMNTLPVTQPPKEVIDLRPYANQGLRLRVPLPRPRPAKRKRKAPA